jgi:hypothetical protein
MKKLNEYLDTRGIKHWVFAELIGCGKATMHKILKKKHIPQLLLAIRIEEETGGYVNVYDWSKDSKSSKQKLSPSKKKTVKQDIKI